MKRFNQSLYGMEIVEVVDGLYILFTDHEVAIKKAVEDAREAIVQYLIDQGTIECGCDGEQVYYITADDIATIRRRST